MATSSVLFQHEFKQKEPSKITKRREAMLALVPTIEKSYAKALKNKKLNLVSEKASDEALRFYNAVVTDGRYIGLLATKPEQVAEKLRLNVSHDALQTVQSVVMGTFGPGPVEGPLEAVIAVAVVIACAAPSRGQEEIVLDSSANVSFKL